MKNEHQLGRLGFLKTGVASLGILAVIALAAGVARAANPAAPKASDFKLKLTGVAVADDDEEWSDDAVVSPGKRVVVKSGKMMAAFLIDYDFPTNASARIWLAPNCSRTEGAGELFDSSASGLYSGKGSLHRILHLDDDCLARHVLLKSVRLSVTVEDGYGEALADIYKGDVPVDVVFAKGELSDGAEFEVLKPLPPPAAAVTLRARRAKGAKKGGTSTPPGFSDNLDAALAKAKAEGKLVYVCFSGSDWCSWCMKLEEEVLSQPEFLAGVKDDYELVFIDSPENKGVLSDHAKSANPKLVEKYGIKGFPTALILDGDGNELAQESGYNGKANEYVKKLMNLRKGNPAEDEDE